MNARRLVVLAMLIAAIGGRAYANDALTIVQQIGTAWQSAYNAGEAAKVADLYFRDAVVSSDVLGNLKGSPEIEKAIADQMKKTPKITVTSTQAWQSGNVIWGYGDFAFANGPSGHYGITALGNAGTWRIAMHISNATQPKGQ
jgi:ketosteroid isomerase-like protein